MKMNNIPIKIINHKQNDQDPTPIPNWLDDPEQVAPCPCGGDFDPKNCLMVEGDVGLTRWFHPECLDFLEKEMDEEEIEEKHEWERQMKRMQEGNQDE